MGLRSFICLIFVGLIACIVHGQGDSLRSALNAVDRRDKILTEEEEEDPYDNPYDANYFQGQGYPELPYSDEYYENNNEIPEEEYPSSAFREKLEEDKQKQIRTIAQRFLDNFQMTDMKNDDDYKALVREISNRYEPFRNPLTNARNTFLYHKKKRAYYPYFGYDNVGLRRRRNHLEQALESNARGNTLPYSEYRHQSEQNAIQPAKLRDIVAQMYGIYSPSNYDTFAEDSSEYPSDYRMAHYSVSKRSSDYEKPVKMARRFAKTDPKVEKDLSAVFGNAAKLKELATDKVTKPTPKTFKKLNKTKNAMEDVKKRMPENVEVVDEAYSKKPIRVEKKSVEWTDYFGLDRRKKSANLDPDWLLHRYHKAVGEANKKNVNFPVHKFIIKRKRKITDEELKEMDTELKQMEDTLVDDALKYSGAHEGATDSKEIQEVKDRVISRLAAAYSIEKMRLALEEYKLAVAQERERLKHEEEEVEDDDDFTFSEDKRVSVPRKEAINPDLQPVEIEDNHIKCAHGGADCTEKKSSLNKNDYNTASILDTCPHIQRACNQVSTVLGQYAKIFEGACNIYQMCLFCGEGAWFTPTKECNILFLNAAFDLCDGQPECKKEAQSSVRYLLDVNRSLRIPPIPDCELACPDKA